LRILVVEDDNVLAAALTRALSQAAYAVDLAENGADANAALDSAAYDLVVLDLALPEVDGLDVLRRLRGRRVDVPVLVLSARDSLHDRVKGLDLGADDYITKPFDLPEFEARVRALMRRGQRRTTNVLRHGRLALDVEARRVFHDGRPLELSAREHALLELLLSRQGRVVTKEQIVERVFGWGEDVGSNTVEVCMHRVRRKLEPFGIEIRTVRGMGYLLEKASDAGPADAA